MQSSQLHLLTANDQAASFHRVTDVKAIHARTGRSKGEQARRRVGVPSLVSHDTGLLAVVKVHNLTSRHDVNNITGILDQTADDEDSDELAEDRSRRSQNSTGSIHLRWEDLVEVSRVSGAGSVVRRQYGSEPSRNRIVLIIAGHAAPNFSPCPL